MIFLNSEGSFKCETTHFSWRMYFTWKWLIYLKFGKVKNIISAVVKIINNDLGSREAWIKNWRLWNY